MVAEVMAVGRIVWGHPMKAQDKKSQETATKGQPILKNGQPVKQWAFGLAIERAVFERDIWPAMYAEALTGYPAGVPGRFSYKFKDGDKDVDSAGKPYRDREGYPGHIVLTISTEAFQPQCVKLENGAYRQLVDAEIKTGDFAAAKLSFKVNVATGQNTPSLYVNPIIIEWIGYGTEIQSSGTVDAMAALGGVARALPPGASATPLAPVAGVGYPTGGTPAPGGMPGAMPGAPMMAPPAPPPAPIAAPAPPPPPPPPPAPAPGMARPTDPTHIAPGPNGGELWWNGAAWVPAPAADFVANAGMPGMMPPRP